MDHPDPARTAAEVALENPEIRLVLEKIDVKFEDAEDTTLVDIYGKRGLSGRTLAWLLEATQRDHQLRDWNVLQNYEVSQLVGYVLFNHHQYAKMELPRLELVLEKAVRQDYPNHSELPELKVFSTNSRNFCSARTESPDALHGSLMVTGFASPADKGEEFFPSLERASSMI